MGLVERTRNLLTRDLECLSSGEGAPSRLRRYLQDLEWTHRGLMEASRQAGAARQYLERRLQRGAHDSELWAQRAELALRRRNETLARVALLNKAAVLADSPTLEREMTRVAQEQRDLTEHMNQLRQRILAARCLRQMAAADNRDKSQATGTSSALMAEVDRELDMLKERLRRERGKGSASQ